MIRHALNYLVCMIAGALVGGGAGALFGDVLTGGAIGLVVGFFVGVGVYAWNTQDEPDSFENRFLGD